MPKQLNRPTKDTMLKYLKNQVLGEKRFNTAQKACRIISVSPQGNVLYAIARYPDINNLLPNGLIENIKGNLVGNEGLVKEEDLLLAEILVPTDIDLSITKAVQLKTLIGTQCLVELVDQRPVRIITSGFNINPRSIDSLTIRKARSVSPDKSLSKDSQEYLKGSGYSDETIKKVLAEKYKDKDFGSKVLVYGDAAVWGLTDAESVKKDPAFVDVTAHATKLETVTSLPVSKLKKKICYKPPIIFTAIS